MTYPPDEKLWKNKNEGFDVSLSSLSPLSACFDESKPRDLRMQDTVELLFGGHVFGSCQVQVPLRHVD